MHRAYSLLSVKALDGDRRILTGTASTPEPDRVGDVIEPLGVQFKNPLPLLLFHDAKRPVGTVTFHKPTKDGITFEAKLAEVEGPPSLVERIEEAWASVKAGLIRGVSVGFRPLDDGMELMKTGGWRFTKTEVLELSLVVIPANASALIETLKSYDAPHLAATGNGQGTEPRTTPGDAGTPVVRVLPARSGRAMKTIAEQIVSFKSTRDQKWSEMNEIMTKAGEKGETLDAEQSQRYDALQAEVEKIDEHLKRLEDMEAFQKTQAKAVVGTDPQAAHASRGGGQPVIRVSPNDPPGIGFAKAVQCKMASFVSMTKGEFHSPLDFAKQYYPDNDRVHSYLKAAIPAATTTDSAWAGVLVDPTNLAGEFIEYLRPMTIIGKFGTGNIPSLRQVPFNVRILGQSSGGDAYWVGQGAPKPVTKFDFTATTLGFTKVAAISVLSEELARFSMPNAVGLIRDGLAGAVVERIDKDLVDPAQSAVANVNPASLTNGLTAQTSAGTTADNARADVAALIKAYLDANNRASSLVLIMPDSLALSLSVMVNSLGQPEFPSISMGGGSLLGIPVITSQYVANQSGAGNMVIAVNASDVFLADDGQVTVDVSREASLQMLDNPTNSSATATATTMVSLWQTNSIGLRAERFINWAKRRAEAVVYMDDVNWGSIGSPA